MKQLSTVKKIIIFITAILAVLLITKVNVLFSENSGNTVAEREVILNEKISGTSIVSEVEYQDFIICQIQRSNQIGYAVFENKGAKYKYNEHHLSNEDILFGTAFMINGQGYHVLICNKPNLDMVEIVFSDPDSGEVIESRSKKLNGKMMCIIEEPEASSYSVDWKFYDTAGNVFE